MHQLHGTNIVSVISDEVSQTATEILGRPDCSPSMKHSLTNE